MSDPAPMDIRPARQGVLARLSVVWLVPLIALAVSLAVAWQSYKNRGTLIEISFENASGIAADATVIKYRDVDVGTVEDVSFSPGLDVVIVSARIDKTVAPYLDDDAQFWVVTPDVSVRGISGLETVLSGVFIEGSWDTQNDVAQTNFVGLEEPPLTTANQRGTAIVLRAQDGSALASGAPILHKGIEVGYLETPQLSPNGQNVTVNAFIEEPYDRILTTNTRFWDTSGFSISLGASGVSLDVDSIASLIEGGIAFDTVVSGGAPVHDGQTFNLFESAEVARESLFDDGRIGELVNVSVLFDGSVNGLTVGSDVRFQGITIGEVIDLSAVVAEDTDDTRIQLRAVLGIDPSRLGMQNDATAEYALNFLSDYVGQGLRARLATGNILSGALIVQLTEVEDAVPATFDLSAEPYPVLPTAPSAITDVADTADDVLQRINDLPIEDLMNGAISLMNSIESLANDDQLRAAPESLVALLDDTRSLITSEDIQAIAPDIRALLADADTLVASFAEAELASALTALMIKADLLGTALVESSEDWPAITEQAQSLIATANALELEALVAQANEVLGSANGFLASENFAALPEALQQTLTDGSAAITDLRTLIAGEDLQAIPTDVRTVLADLDSILATVQASDVLDNVNAAAASAAAAAVSIQDGAASLPQIAEQTQDLLAKINALELESIVASSQAALDQVNTVLSSEGVANLPDVLASTMTTVETAVADLNILIAGEDTQAIPADVRKVMADLTALVQSAEDSEMIAMISAAAESATLAAQSVEDGTAGLPAIMEQTEALVATANALELDALVASANETLDSVSTLLSNDGTQALPQSLADAAEELQNFLAEVREGGAITNVNAALASANSAAQAIEDAAESLPALSARASSLLRETESLLESYGDRSRFNTETLSTLRDISEAADAISALARTIQRNPNSLLTGR